MHRRQFLQAVSLGALITAGEGAAVAAEAAALDPAPVTQPSATGGRQRLSLNEGWKFFEGDIPFPKIIGHGWTYANAKAGSAWGGAAPDYDDSAWPEVNLPHDFAVEQPFDPKENLSQGYRKRGYAWYRRALRLDESDRGRHIELQFDGIATYATIWINGIIAHRSWSGYVSSYIDITPYALYGDELNSIVIRVDAESMEGWWYEGAGLYRHAWLIKSAPTHVISDGIYAAPRKQAGGGWTVPVEITLANSGKADQDADLFVQLLDPKGAPVAQGRATVKVAALAGAVAHILLDVASPQLWSVDQPTLYTLAVIGHAGGEKIEDSTTAIGFRSLRFDADHGFFLNDQPLKIKGVCLHQDHAGVGVAVPDALWEYRIRRLKEIGCNAIRSAHNPPAKSFLDACDRMGMLVMDENRTFNSDPEHIRLLEWMIRRDRNHPSVYLWSVFNEEPMQGTEVGYQMVRRLVKTVKDLDDTRPVTAAMNSGMFEPYNVSQAVDVVGFNYQQDVYDAFHKAHPNLPIMSSEDTSTYMSRGEFTTDPVRHVAATYDDDNAPWGETHHAAWKAVDTRPFVAGGFCWTGLDYRGEPTPFDWPSASSVMGIMDLCGFPKTAYYWHQAMWIKSRPLLTLAPHWNWPGKEGQPIRVMAITNAASVALSLNGKLISKQPVDPYEMVSWKVPYAPGHLEAIGYDAAGKVIARTRVETTDAPAALRLTLDRPQLAGDGRDTQPIMVEALDKHGRPVPTANLMAFFEISGPAKIIGVGNGDANCHEPEHASQRSLYNGLAQVIVQSVPDGHGPVIFRAKADGLKPAEVRLDVAAAPRPPFVPRTPAVQSLRGWRLSPPSLTRPDPQVTLADNDMNSWNWVGTGALQPVPVAPWSLLRAKFTPRATVRAAGGRLVFRKLGGRAEIWINGQKIGQKTDPAPADFSVALAPGDGERTLTVVIDAAGAPFGFGGGVRVEDR